MTKHKLPSNNLPIPIEFIERRIYLIRGRKVMIDADLAEFYQVLTKNLNLAVRRNFDRFPQDFIFQLNKVELANLRLQFATSNEGRGGRRYLPYAFTEHGVAMLSSVLNSKRAVQMNILIIRAFIQLREILASNQNIAQKIKGLERRQMRDGARIDVIYKIVRRLIQTPVLPKNPIGFRTT